MLLQCVECRDTVDDNIVDVTIIKKYYCTDDPENRGYRRDVPCCEDCVPYEYHRCSECKKYWHEGDMEYPDKKMQAWLKDYSEFTDVRGIYPSEENRKNIARVDSYNQAIDQILERLK